MKPLTPDKQRRSSLGLETAVEASVSPAVTLSARLYTLSKLHLV